MRLALHATGILAELTRRNREWLLLVDGADLPAALQEIEAYRSESSSAVRPKPPPIPELSSGRLGVLAYAVVLVGVAALADRRTMDIDWLQAGRMQAGLVAEGQWWRVFTALTLHLDAAHLLANLFLGAVLGLFAAQALGGGVSWLGILLAGGLGNALNAVVQDSQHSAVGASTAVFAALGILVSHALYYRRRLPGGAARRWSPLVGGLLLLAYTGMGGERTDVLAHVTGLLAGLILGLLGSRLSTGLLERRDVQLAASLFAVVLLVFAWFLAVSPARA
jgi:membrane associated rhomboid family serine protease